jgi:hypothetical protein
MSSKPTLLGLPVELREEIFRLVIQLEEAEAQKPDPENKWLTEHLGDLVAIRYSDHRPPILSKAHGGAFGHQLLRLSKACYLEAAPMVYERESFYLFNDYDWSMWWRVQAFLFPPSFELHHMDHPTPYGFASIRELGFQPSPEFSVDFVRAVETNFPSLHTLRAFRHVFVHDPMGHLTGELPAVWTEFHRFVLSAAVVIASNHPKLKFAKWSDWRFFPNENADTSIRTMTAKLTTDTVLSPDEVCNISLLNRVNTEHEQEGLLDLDRISELPLYDPDAWRNLVKRHRLRVGNYFLASRSPANDQGDGQQQEGSRPKRVRASDVLRSRR